MLKITRTTAAALATAVLGLGAFSACGVADAKPVPASQQQDGGGDAAADYTYLLTVTDDPVQEPGSFLVDNSDFVRSLEGLVWSGWGSAEATATGTLVADSRTETGEGQVVKYPVKVVVSEIVQGEATQTYSKLTVTATGGDRQGYPATEEFTLNSVEKAPPMADPALEGAEG